MKRNKITIKAEWIRVGNVFSLLVEVDEKIFTKKFSMYSIEESAQSAIELNKKLKEYDLAAELKQQFKVKKVEFI